MPAIISIILIRLDQFIIAVPRATSHLNEFNWKLGKNCTDYSSDVLARQPTGPMSLT